MTAIISELPIHIPGDAWAHFTPAAKAEEAQELDTLVQQYLAQGGTVTELPAGVTTDTPAMVQLRSQVSLSQFTPQQHAAHNAKRQRKATARDLELAETIKTLLPAKTRMAITKALKVSDGKVQALIRAHLADNEDAMALLKPRHDNSEKIAKVRQALDMGIQGYYNICKYAGVSYGFLKQLETKLRLTIKPAVGGHRKKEAKA